MKDFCGFRFGNIHSESLHLVVVSSSDRYEKNLLPEITNYSADVPGGDGKYYFGSTFGTREFVVQVAYDSVSEPIFRKIQQLFATDKPQDLVFDELPYKTYKAKLKNKPEFKHICFINRDTGERVYKGEGTLNFICYTPFAYGLNKYVVRAADYYKCVPPETIITGLINQNPYLRKPPLAAIEPYQRKHYNTYWNMNTPWKGGFPTIEQVQGGELYFVRPPIEIKEGENSDRYTDPQTASTSPTPDGKSLIIDVRGYWDNIPEWQSTARLLTTPTLDPDQELIFMPQYNRLNYMNMETGLNNEQGVIGSRILVYNPGDLPVDFELKIDNIQKRFRAENGAYNFRISRYNVQRLTIEEAVDWTHMKTANIHDEQSYKYGNRYFKILEKSFKIQGQKGLSWFGRNERLLKKAHPRHCYIIEPIPKKKLSHYIKLFYWQSYRLGKMSEDEWHHGIDIANHYDELLSQCITENEENELYWETLEVAIVDAYEQYFEKNHLSFDREGFIQSFFQNPSEYIKINEDSAWTDVYTRKYGEVDFNLTKLPQYITEDYIELNSDKLHDDTIVEPNESANINHDTMSKSVFIDFERRMVYNINEPEWKNNKTWLSNNLDKVNNLYNYKPTKTIRNEAIEYGRWFKLPPGWSLISIDPIIDENKWGGKLWKDARPFSWGNSGTQEDEREKFNEIYYSALRQYLKANCPDSIIEQFATERDKTNGEINWNIISEDHLEDFAGFRRWYGDDEDFYRKRTQKSNPYSAENLYYSLVHKRNEDAEYGFLRMLSSYWNLANTDEQGRITSEIKDWWWKASSYIWENFPPLYWGYADLLNSIQIKYTPLFY